MTTEVRSWKVQRLFRPNLGPPSVQSSEYCGPTPAEQISPGVKMIIHLRLALSRLRIRLGRIHLHFLGAVLN
jgi:hypothetical protein